MENKNVSNFISSVVYELNADYFACPVSRANESANSATRIKTYNAIFDASVKLLPPKLTMCYYKPDRVNSGFVCQLEMTEEAVRQHFENDVNLFINDDTLKVYGRHFGRAMKYGIVIDEDSMLDDIIRNGYASVQLRYYAGTSMLIGHLKLPVIQRLMDNRVLDMIINLTSHFMLSAANTNTLNNTNVLIPSSPPKVIPFAQVTDTTNVTLYDNLEDTDIILNNTETAHDNTIVHKSKGSAGSGGNKRRRIGGTNLMPMKQK